MIIKVPFNVHSVMSIFYILQFYAIISLIILLIYVIFLRNILLVMQDRCQKNIYFWVVNDGRHKLLNLIDSEDIFFIMQVNAWLKAVSLLCLFFSISFCFSSHMNRIALLFQKHNFSGYFHDNDQNLSYRWASILIDGCFWRYQKNSGRP